jgi:hypothetical protein
VICIYRVKKEVPMTKRKQQNSSSPRRKRGGQPGNTNALKHGFYSDKLKQDYLDQLTAYAREHGVTHGSDVKSIRAMIYTVVDNCPQKLTPDQAVALLRAVTQASNSIDRLTRPAP